MSLLVYGTLIGLVYGLWSVSFSIIYRSVRIFHVLHAAVFTASAYACWLVATSSGQLLLGIVAGLAAAIVLGAASELILYRPLIRLHVRSGILFLASLAGYVVVENVLQLLWRADTRTIELPLFFDTRLRLGSAGVSVLEVSEALVALCLWLLTLALLRFSLWGKAIRAISIAPEMAELAGINVGKIRLIAFMYGSFLVGTAGILFLAKLGVEPTSGMPVWIIAVVASLISRAHPLWSYVTGLGIGLCEAVILLWLPGTWQPIVPVAILLAYLTVLAANRVVVATLARNRAQRALGHA